jgi:hypothetical protein
MKDLFLKEKLANKYCEQYNIKEKDRINIINAFCVGFNFGEKYTIEKQIEDMKKFTDLNPWYWRSVGEKCYAFDVVEAITLHEFDSYPEPGSQLFLDEDEQGNLIWIGENGTHMLIVSYIACVEEQNGNTICNFIAKAHAKLIGKEFLINN